YRQIFGDVGQDHLGDDQRDNEPVQELGDVAPAAGSVSDAHSGSSGGQSAITGLRIHAIQDALSYSFSPACPGWGSLPGRLSHPSSRSGTLPRCGSTGGSSLWSTPGAAA